MIFKSLEIQNFMAIRTAKIELDNQGLVLIKGDNQDNPNFQSNGAGKSTIIEAMVYALYGRTIRGLKGDDIVNNVAKANTKVVLDVIDDDGSEYRITRYRKHKENKNSVFLFCNGKDITPKSEADFTKRIIDLLQTDFMTLTSSIVYSAESFKFTQATDAELKSAFDVMLDLKVYSDCQEEVKTELRELTSKRSSLDSKLRILDNKKSVLEESKQNVEELSEKFDSDNLDKIESIKEKIEEIEDEKVDTEESVEELKSQLDELQSEIMELKKKCNNKSSSETEDAISQIRDCIDESEDDKSKVKLKIRKIASSIEQCEDDIDSNETKKSKNIKNIDKMKKTLNELEETVGTPCPTCGKPLDESHIQSAVEECNSQIDKSNSVINDCDKSISELSKKIDEYREDKQELEEEVDDIDTDLKKYHDLLSKLQKKLKQEQEVSSEVLSKEKQYNRVEREYNNVLSDLKSYDDKIKNLNEEIDELKEQKNPYDAQIKQYKHQIKQLQPEYNELNEEKQQFDSDEQVLNFWLQGFSNSGIKSMLLDDITPFLNQRTNRYLRALSGDHIAVNFTTQTKLKSGELREKFQIEILNQDGGNSYISNSSGEKRRIDVAINLALQDLISSRANKKINLVFLDEVLDALDSAGIEDVLKLLQEISKEKSSVFVISHNENIQTSFENFLVVRKNGGYSTIVKE